MKDIWEKALAAMPPKEEREIREMAVMLVSKIPDMDFDGAIELLGRIGVLLALQEKYK